MRRADRTTGIILLIFSLILMDASRRMPPSATFGPGAGFLPFWLGALMAILSVLLIVQAFRRPATPVEKPAFPSGKALVAVGEAVAGLALYILLLETLGFLVGTGLLTAYLLGVVEREEWRTTILVAVLNSVGLYFVFGHLLGVSLPRNMFGF
ncbi:MAG: tripartite tricarboxylate transporter TctB family protein [candidate division NC10 bacterium]|nr:tripartite tricarboxylate transporter TctB family protein [candidate division NC10 bacterium]